MDPELLSIDELPIEARQAIDEVEREMNALREQASRQMDEIRARADQEISEIVAQVHDDVRERQMELLRLLRPMQESAMRAGQLDEALAIRDRIRGLRATLLQAQQDPGNLSFFEAPRPGSTQLFEVTGTTEGIVWGSDVYTGDSRLAAVAVHSGAVADGERAVVRVTFVDTMNVSFTGSLRNGVQSEPYGPWPTGVSHQSSVMAILECCENRSFGCFSGWRFAGRLDPERQPKLRFSQHSKRLQPHDRQLACFNTFHAPPSALDATHCVMKFMPSTPSLTLG